MDPVKKFSEWFEAARGCKDIADATAISLATAEGGKPSVRVVLLKDFDADGFVFYTNMQSRKGHELSSNPQAALCFYWAPLGRQIRIEGRVEQVSAAEADAYFASRPRESQLGAWASKQSEVLSSRAELEAAFAAEERKYAGRDVPRPPHWSGWRVVPERIEFWQQGSHRLHERELFIRDSGGWRVTRLYP